MCMSEWPAQALHSCTLHSVLNVVSDKHPSKVQSPNQMHSLLKKGKAMQCFPKSAKILSKWKTLRCTNKSRNINILCVVVCREYRDARKIPLNVEHRMMLGMAPDYDHLMVIQKVEVFEHALDSTSGT